MLEISTIASCNKWQQEETENYRKFKEALVNTISAEALEEYVGGNPDDLMRMKQKMFLSLWDCQENWLIFNRR